MPTPLFNQRVLDLSQRIFDPRTTIGEPDANHDYPEALLALALNSSVRDFLTALIEKEDIEAIVRAVPEYVVEEPIGFLTGEADMPATALKGLALKGVLLSIPILGIYVTPDKWYAIKTEYNREEIDSSNPRWTEYSRIVRINVATNLIMDYLYIKNHIDVVIDGATDLVLNQRFYNQLLDLATEYIKKLSPVT